MKAFWSNQNKLIEFIACVVAIYTTASETSVTTLLGIQGFSSLKTHADGIFKVTNPLFPSNAEDSSDTFPILMIFGYANGTDLEIVKDRYHLRG